jgi:radical SAM protein with 4Fe4S-binding SPASM domain
MSVAATGDDVRLRVAPRHMAKRIAKQAYELTGCNWELTLRCTLKCIHCGSRAGRARASEMSLDECVAVADDLVALGCQEVTLIGGEVFLYRGWERLSAYLVGKGVTVNIVSNGYLIRSQEVDQIKRAGLVNVGISIDGLEATHNKIRGRKDAFLRVTESLELLRKEGIRTGVITTLMKLNFADMEGLYLYLIEHDVQVWQLQLASAMGNMADRNEALVSREQVRQVIEFIREKNREQRMVTVAADSIGYFVDNEAEIRGSACPICYWGGCAAGVSSVFIDSVGNVKGCGALYADEFIEGNLRASSLAEIWGDSNKFAYNRKFTPDLLAGDCAGCSVGHLCKGGCRSSNYFSTGSLYSNAFCCRHS